jgi:uncharacterized membrane protein YGL010W
MIALLIKRFNAHFKAYRAAHRTVGCKITHLIGVPMIELSIIFLFIDVRIATLLFVGGWILQFIGHFVFEHNSPMVAAKGAIHLTLLSAAVFVAQEWFYLLFGHSCKTPALRLIEQS